MEVFRISSVKYSKSLAASGKSSRWNKDNEYVIYASQSRALATLENIAHMSILPAIPFETIVISISDDKELYKRISSKKLPADWRSIASYAALQEMGSEWYRSNESLILQVPSVIIPQEFNYVINTRHPDFTKHVKLLRNEPYYWEKRLF